MTEGWRGEKDDTSDVAPTRPTPWRNHTSALDQRLPFCGPILALGVDLRPAE